MDTLPATTEQAVERFPYTVEWRYPEPMRGGAVGGSVVINARDQAEARSKVETMLRKKGTAWDTITVVKGRDQGLTMKGGGLERYYHELTALLGIGNFNLYAWSSNEPSPMWASSGLMPDPNGTARSWWTKFMDESSHGLAVSDFPRFIICDVEGYPTLPLPAEMVRDPKRWDRITTVMRDQLDYWKARLQERIDRLGKVNRPSAEDAEQLKQDKATLKELEAFDGWTYEAYVEAMLPGRVPNPMDLDNLRLYRLSNGQLIPITNLGPDQLRVDFWRRLLELRDGPGDKWADAVREFLDHHYRNGGKAERFRDLVKVTAQRLRDMVSKGASPRNTERWGLLADKLEGWLSKAEVNTGAEFLRGVMDDIRGDMGLPPTPKVMPPASSLWQGRTVVDAFDQLKHEAHYCLLSLLRDSAAEVEAYRLKRGRTLKAYRPELEHYVNALGNQGRELAAQWYHAGGSPHYGLTLTNLGRRSGPLTQRWERWIDGFVVEVTSALIAHGRSDQAAKEVARLASGIAQLSIGSPERTAYEERLELAKQDLSNKGQHAAPGDIAAMFQGHIEGFDTWRDRLLERVGAVGDGTGVSVPLKSHAKPAPPTLISKFETVPGSLDKWMALLRSEGLVDEAGRFTMAADAKGKGKLIAAWVAAVEVFQLAAYPLDTELSKALIAHLPGLSGLDRLDKVRKTKSYTDNVEKYKEALQDD